jgi:hypothetical protein
MRQAPLRQRRRIADRRQRAERLALDLFEVHRHLCLPDVREPSTEVCRGAPLSAGDRGIDRGARRRARHT